MIPENRPSGALSRWLLGLAHFAERRHRAVLLVVLVVMAVAVGLLTRIRFDPDVLGLLPPDDPEVQTFRHTLELFGALDLLLVVVRVPEDAPLAPHQDLVDRLGRTLEGMDDLEWVEYRLGDPEDLLRAFYPRALLYLDAEDRDEVLRRLEPEALEARAEALRRQLTTPQAVVAKNLVRLDPLGMSEIFLRRLGEGRGDLGIDWASGHYLSRDRRLLLLLAKPEGAAQDVEFTRRLVSDVEAAVESVRADWPERAGPDAGPAPEVALGGTYLTALDDTELIRGDFLVNAFTSMGVVLLLFLFAFRRLGLLVYAFLPLTCGLMVTFGAAGGLGGVLSAPSSACAALLVGLGIDFVIVSYGRYVEERRRGVPAEQALVSMTGSCGRAVVVGGVTSAATFLAFAVTDFTGLRQMGLLTAAGILACMVSVLVVLPALLAWSESRHRQRDTVPNLYVHGFGAHRLVRASMAHPKRVLAVGLTLTAAALVLLPRLGFESAIQNMRPEGNRGILVQEEVAHHFGSNFRYMMMVLSGDTQAEALDLASETAQGAAPLVADGELYRVDSIASLLPSPSRQREVLDWLADARGSGLDPDAVRGRFERALEANGLRPAAFAESLDLLVEALSATEPVGIADLEALGGSKRLVERYLRPDGDGFKSVVYLYPPVDKWRREPPPALEVLEARLGPGAELTGVNVVSRALRRQVWIDAVLAAVLGTLMVAILLWFDYRRIRDTVLSLVPLAVGIVWMLGVMAALGIDLNFMNVFVTTMIIGIGVDYGVHMLHRHRELRGRGLEERVAGLAETGRAIVMAAVTTCVGFGSLALSHYPGIRSIGFVAILGAVSTALVAITLLPAFLVLEPRDRG